MKLFFSIVIESCFYKQKHSVVLFSCNYQFYFILFSRQSLTWQLTGNLPAAYTGVTLQLNIVVQFTLLHFVMEIQGQHLQSQKWKHHSYITVFRAAATKFCLCFVHDCQKLFRKCQIFSLKALGAHKFSLFYPTNYSEPKDDQ